MKVSNKGDKFLWVGNAPAIDFVNTQIVQQGVTVDLLDNSGDLLEWLGSSGMLEEGPLRQVTRKFTSAQLQRALRDAKEYRMALRRALQRISHHGTVDKSVLEDTNRFLGEPRSTFRLTGTKQAPQLQQQWVIRQPEDLSRPIAFAFAHLLADQDISRVRKCRNPECILFFLDTSKSGTRAWCSLDICGNKSRVAAFRERRAREKPSC